MMEGKKIKLRAPEPSDIDSLYEWENNPKFWHLSSTLVPFSRFDIEQYVLAAEKDIYKTRQMRLMIVNKADDIPVGNIDLFDFSPQHRRLGLGILIDEKWQGQGFASEALDLCIEYCFDHLMLHQVYANILPNNTQSIKLFEQKNFIYAATKKDWLWINGQWTDERLYQLIKPKTWVNPKVLGHIDLSEIEKSVWKKKRKKT